MSRMMKASPSPILSGEIQPVSGEQPGTAQLECFQVPGPIQTLALTGSN